MDKYRYCKRLNHYTEDLRGSKQIAAPKATLYAIHHTTLWPSNAAAGALMDLIAVPKQVQFLPRPFCGGAADLEKGEQQ